MDEFEQYLAKKQPAQAQTAPDEFAAYLAKKQPQPAAEPAAPTVPPPPPQEQPGALHRAWNWLTDTGGEPAAPSGREGWGKIRSEQAAAGIDPNSREANDPIANDWGAQGIIGGIAGGAASKLVGPLASKLGPLAKFATSATEGAVANKVQGGEASTGALIGGAMAVPSVAAAGARSAQTALRNPQRELGRTIRALDEAKTSGITKDPAFKALPKGAEGFNQTANTAEQQMAAHGDSSLAQARKDYGDTLDEILKGHADRDHVVTHTADTIDKLAAENVINGEVVDEHLAKALGKVSRMISKDTGAIDMAALKATGDVKTMRAPAVKVGDLVKVKKAVAKMADHGVPATPETRPYRILEETIGKELEAVDPRVGEMNKRYAETMGKLEEANDILYAHQSPDIRRTTAAAKRARGLLGRIGDSTQAATLARPDIERLKQLDPAYAQAMAPVEAKKAVERTRFGLPHVSRRIEHMPFTAVMQNLDALGAQVADPLLGRIGGAGNAPPSGAMQLFNAAREKQRRETEAATQLGGNVPRF